MDGSGASVALRDARLLARLPVERKLQSPAMHVAASYPAQASAHQNHRFGTREPIGLIADQIHTGWKAVTVKRDRVVSRRKETVCEHRDGPAQLVNHGKSYDGG